MPGTSNGDKIKVHQLEIEIANTENIKPYGFFISEEGISESSRCEIPFYDTVSEGVNLDATWKDQPCVRMSQIYWRDDQSVAWLERHMEMTQAFIVVGRNPAIFVLGEPTHDDPDENQQTIPDISNAKAIVVPGGYGIILKIGTWHDFPVSCGPPVTCFIINTEEVVDALLKCKLPRPMNEGDCYKLKLSEHFDFTITFPDPRAFVQDHGLVQLPNSRCLMGVEGYGQRIRRCEVPSGWGDGGKVFVIPVINIEVFKPGCGGPAIQPHLKSIPEIANKGWRDYGNRCGLGRLAAMFRSLGIPATAVINSDTASLSSVAKHLELSEWEIGAHGINNSEGNAHMTRKEEEIMFKECLDNLTNLLGVKPRTWLTPGFSVTERTVEIATAAGIDVLLDFVDDDVPYMLNHEEKDKGVLCFPYCLETNDFSLVLTKNLDPQQYAQAIEFHVRQLAKEDGEKVVCLGMHTFVAGTPARVYALSKMFERLKDLSEVRFATASEVHDLIKRKV